MTRTIDEALGRFELSQSETSRRSRCPTEKQYRKLRILGSGAAWVVGTKGDVEPLLRHGWVTADPPTDARRYYAWIRITPDGLRALAEAVERYGLPELEGPGSDA